MSKATMKKAMLEGLMGGLFEGHFQGFPGVDEDDHGSGDTLSESDVLSYLKEPEHILSDASAIGENAKMKAQFEYFSTVVEAMYVEAIGKDDELKALEERAEADQQRIRSFMDDCRNFSNTIGHLRGELGQVHGVLDSRNEALQTGRMINTEVLRVLREALSASSPAICARFKPVLEILVGNDSAEAPIATDEGEADNVTPEEE